MVTETRQTVPAGRGEMIPPSKGRPSIALERAPVVGGVVGAFTPVASNNNPGARQLQDRKSTRMNNSNAKM